MLFLLIIVNPDMSFLEHRIKMRLIDERIWRTACILLIRAWRSIRIVQGRSDEISAYNVAQASSTNRPFEICMQPVGHGHDMNHGVISRGRRYQVQGPASRSTGRVPLTTSCLLFYKKITTVILLINKANCNILISVLQSIAWNRCAAYFSDPLPFSRMAAATPARQMTTVNLGPSSPTGTGLFSASEYYLHFTLTSTRDLQTVTRDGHISLLFYGCSGDLGSEQVSSYTSQPLNSCKRSL